MTTPAEPVAGRAGRAQHGPPVSETPNNRFSPMSPPAAHEPNPILAEAVPVLPTRRAPRPAWPLIVGGLLAVAMVFLIWRYDPRRAPLPLCAFHATTGLYCPGCGATRATHELLHGRLFAALRCNALWVGMLPVAACVALVECLRLARGRGLKHDLLRSPRLWAVLAAIAVLFALLRNVPLFPLTLLVPSS